MNNNDITFDDLDKEFIKQMPLVVDVITSTYNKIGRFFQPYHEDMRELLKKGLGSKRGWNIAKEEKKVFSPLTSENKFTKIKQLENYFALNYIFTIEKSYKDKVQNRFYVEMGHYFDYTKDEECNYFYFNVYRGKEDVRKYEVLNDLKFYKDIKENNDGFKIDIEHPEQDNDYETIEIVIEELNAKKIDQTYKFFKLKIIPAFIGNLK